MSVKRVTDIIAEISAASQEQSAGIEQVNTAVTQMDKITQQNAALVEQAAAAAKSMEEQTASLAEMVAGFTLVEDEAPARMPARRPTASAAPDVRKPKVPTPSRSPMRSAAKAMPRPNGTSKAATAAEL